MKAEFKGKIEKIPGMNKFISDYKKYKIKKIYKKDANYFIKNYCYAKNNTNSIEYRMMLEIHCIEKGMSVTNPRIFGINHINKIINLIELYNKYSDNNKSYTYNLAFSILEEYKTFFEKKNWVETENYKIVTDFLKEKKYTKIECGANLIKKEDIKKYYDIDYFNFMKIRKSVRNFKEEAITKDDLNDVLEIVRLTPSACNRQMCKLYLIEDESKKNILSERINGLTCFNKKSLNYFVITYDQNAFFTVKERNQGFFNAGLFTMNFVNAMHSKGIGTCILQGDNPPKDEQKLKEELGIPENEKISVFVVGGYYDNQFKVPVSPRKLENDIFFIK